MLPLTGQDHSKNHLAQNVSSVQGVPQSRFASLPQGFQ